MMDIALLQSLSDARGVSGQEANARQVVLRAIEGHADNIRIDPMGSVTAVRPGTAGRGFRVMLAAHMDEVGFMVSGIDGDGLLRFAAVGGIDDRILPALRVRVGQDALPGLILWTPIHMNRDQNVVKLANLRIDIGASGRDEASGKVKIGDMVTFDTAFTELRDGMVRGKAFDDRAGCCQLIDVLRGGPYPVEIEAAFTVQEEIGLRGAQVAANHFAPDIAIVLETTTANDIPDPLADTDDPDELNPTCRLLGGPVLTVMDRSMIVHPALLRWVRETAERRGIPYQIKTQLGGGTDGGSIHTSGSGVPTVVLSMPARYIHSPMAYLHRTDYENTQRLLQALLQNVEELQL